MNNFIESLLKGWAVAPAKFKTFYGLAINLALW